MGDAGGGDVISVLIVEDDIVVGLALAMALNITGFRVLGPTGSASRALALAMEERPDIALVDVDLYGRSDGIGVARALAGEHGTSVIFVTGRPEEARAAREHALGLIAKPYDLTAIPRAVHAAHRHRSGKLPVDAPAMLELFR